MKSCGCDCNDIEPCAAKISIFQHLDRDSLVQISRIAVHKKLKRGELLFTPNDNHGLYLISEGRVKVYEVTASGKEYLLRVLQKGDFVGEEALFETEPNYTYGEALTEAKVCLIARTQFLDLLMKYPSIGIKLLEEFSRRMSRTAHQTAANSEPVPARLAEYLLNLMAAHDSETIELPLQIKELASYLGTAPETLSRCFSSLERQGILKRNRRTVTVFQKEKLESLL